MATMSTTSSAGYLFDLRDCIAKDVLERIPVITSSLEYKGIVVRGPLSLRARIKYGGDGTGDVDVPQISGSLEVLPSKALRCFVSMLSLEVVIDNEVVYTYEPEKVNSIKNCRPVVSVIGEEDCPLLLSTVFSFLDNQALELLQSNMILYNEEDECIANISVLKMYCCCDEKLRRDLLGKAKSGSSWVCCLCDCKREDLKDISKIGTFDIAQTSNLQMKKLVRYMESNPDDLPPSQILNMSRGMSHIPITRRNPRDFPPDSLHQCINNGSNLKTCQEICIASEGNPNSNLCKWSKDGVQEERRNAKGLQDIGLNKIIGYVPKVGQISGPIIKKFLTDNEQVRKEIVELIPEGPLRNAFEEVHRKFISIDKVARQISPSDEDINSFSSKASEFMVSNLTNLPFCEPNNQIHSLVEHTSPFFKEKGLRSLGKLSTEGNEAGNSRFKMTKRLQTFRGDLHAQMSQLIRYDLVWLMCLLDIYIYIYLYIHMYIYILEFQGATRPSF